MSMMLCEGCDRLVDTDYEVEGLWEPVYRCESCTEQLADEACENSGHCGQCLPCLARVSYGETA